MSDISVCFALVCGDRVHADFSAHFTMAFVYADQKGLNPVIAVAQSSVVAEGRNMAVSQAMQARCSHLVFLDTDQTFPHDIVTRLMDRLLKDRTALIVAAAVRRRTSPHTLNFRELDDTLGDLKPDATGVREVLRIGTGCMLLDLNVFYKMPRPYFRFSVDEQSGTLVGEDFLFCDQVRKRGGKILLDCDASHRIGHIGQKTIYTTAQRGDVVESDAMELDDHG